MIVVETTRGVTTRVRFLPLILISLDSKSGNAFIPASLKSCQHYFDTFPVTVHAMRYPKCCYGLGCGVGRGLGVCVGLGLGVGVVVGVALTVAVAVAVAVAVGVGVGVPPPTAARISTRPQPYTLFGGPAAPH